MFKFTVNLNAKPYSILSILSRPDLLSNHILDKDENPFSTTRSTSLMYKENNSRYFVHQVNAIFSRYDINTDEPIKEPINVSNLNNTFYYDSPIKVYHYIINYLNNICTNNTVRISGDDTNIEIEKLSNCIKDFILANQNLNKPVIIPNSVVSYLQNAIARMSKPFETYDEIKKNNPYIYNAIKNNIGDLASSLNRAGFED